MLTVKPAILSILALALLALYPQKAIPGDTVPGWEVIQFASDYSTGTTGVGIAIFEGDDVRQTGEQIGEALVREFGKYQAPAQFFVGSNGGNPTAISYYVNENAFGPFNVSEAIDMIGTVAEKHRLARLPDDYPSQD